MSENILISICMITYNHDRYINDAINGILYQKTNHNYELIISNDCSTDDTDSVIKEIIRVHPEGKRIRYFNQKKNLGITPNFLFTLNEAKGKYIAICEGDDYWTDENKLQAQVDFMENNVQYSGCATQAEVIIETDLSIKPFLFNELKKDTLLSKDFFGQRPFHTASLLFKNNLPFDKFPLGILSADRFLYLMISVHGPIKFISKIMCVYRRNDKGITKNVTSRELRKDLKMVKALHKINPDIDVNVLAKFIHSTVINYAEKLYFFDFIRSYLMICYYTFFTNKDDLKRLIRDFPNLVHRYRQGSRIYVWLKNGV